ncbi:MAG: hypothetical protein M1838_000685 [Thelocarpon superellum]|nr:MAG: hypothetical protein M1838_000685 [Thelocarpon superellum]
MNPALIGQTIAVVDRSGKVISSSKTVFSVLKDAKAAYKERKAEVVAERHLKARAKDGRKMMAAEDEASRGGHARKSGRPKHGKPSKPRRHSPSRSERSLTHSPMDLDDGMTPSAPHPASPRLHRSQTTPEGQLIQRRPVPLRSTSLAPDAHIDMDLAYGEIPPPLPPQSPREAELKGLMSKVDGLLMEAHCVQHSVTATIAALQRDPEALAAVALTLAEISNVAAKLAPGALMAMKGSFPAVFALLASPQFMIAAGLGVGVVVVALGGYKIIKKIKARQDASANDNLDMGADVNRIEAWRRGVTEADIDNTDQTSVDGEFISPNAAAIHSSRRRMVEYSDRERGKEREKARSITPRDRDRDRDRKGKPQRRSSGGTSVAGGSTMMTDDGAQGGNGNSSAKVTGAGASLGSSTGKGKGKRRKDRESQRREKMPLRGFHLSDLLR